MLRIIATAAVAIIIFVLTGSVSEPPATFAHEHRTVAENYEFVVGWVNEPALAYEPNALDLRVTFFPNGVPEEEEHGAEATPAEGEATPAEGEEAAPAEEEGQPVVGLEETLQAEIIAGGGAEKRELTLEPAFGEEGAYESQVLPTVPGDYTFRIFGDLEGQQIDESFTSGPETFSVIGEPSEIQFPEQLAPPAPADGESASNSDSSSDDTARALGIIGIIVGVVGLGFGGLAIATRRS
jgi:hypothetical protein